MELKPVICINILDFILFRENFRFHQCFTIREKDQPELLLTEQLYIHFLELPKLTDRRINSKIIMWLEFLKSEGRPNGVFPEMLTSDPDIRKAHEVYVQFTHDEMMRDMYEARLKWKRDQQTILENRMEESREEGREEEKLIIARNMLERGMSPDDICSVTGLSMSVILSLK